MPLQQSDRLPRAGQAQAASHLNPDGSSNFSLSRLLLAIVHTHEVAREGVAQRAGSRALPLRASA
ncbi:MAG: hypothetical protein ACI89J_001899 [Hyphomicrobiaceae bacterium]|jgi:hypothetical protein